MGYINVHPLPLAKMFTRPVRRPDTVGGVEEEATIDEWEGRSGSVAEVYKE